MSTVRNISYRVALFIALLVVAGCATRSISDSGYRSESGYRGQTSGNPLCKGELSEFDLLGINSESKVTQEEINRALESKQRLTVPKGSSIMLIQSGSLIPAEPM